MDIAKNIFIIAKNFYDEHELLSTTCDLLEALITNESQKELIADLLHFSFGFDYLGLLVRESFYDHLGNNQKCFKYQNNTKLKDFTTLAMSTTCFVIPYHRGEEYQIDKDREEIKVRFSLKPYVILDEENPIEVKPSKRIKDTSCCICLEKTHKAILYHKDNPVPHFVCQNCFGQVKDDKCPKCRKPRDEIPHIIDLS